MIFGIRSIIFEAIEAGKEIDKVFLKKICKAVCSRAFTAIDGRDIPVIRVPVEKKSTELR